MFVQIIYIGCMRENIVGPHLYTSSYVYKICNLYICCYIQVSYIFVIVNLYIRLTCIFRVLNFNIQVVYIYRFQYIFVINTLVTYIYVINIVQRGWDTLQYRRLQPPGISSSSECDCQGSPIVGLDRWITDVENRTY